MTWPIAGDLRFVPPRSIADGWRGCRSGRAKTIAAINVTPLVDVCLVLLVILMVASTYIVAQTLKVHLPRARMSDGTAEKPNTVQL